MKCNGCDLEKPADGFHVDRSRPCGRKAKCKECCRATALQFYRDNAPRQNELNKVWRSENKERKAASTKAWASENRGTLAECSRAFRRRNPDSILNTELKARYKISAEAYRQLLAKQGGVCAICGKTCSVWPRLSVDHVHGTDIVRGLLCSADNLGIGQLGESSERLRAAAGYVARFEEDPYIW